MRSSASIRAEILDIKSSAEALIELARQEQRELTDDEVGSIENAHKQIEDKSKELDRSIKFEAIKNSFENIDQREAEDPKPQAKAIVIPQREKVHGKLKAFIGNDGERDAYVSGRWAAANFFNHGPSKKWLKDHGVMNAMSEAEDDRGGVFVPTEMTTAIIRLVEEYGVFRQYAGTEPMGSDRKVVPVRVSGLTATPVAETTRANEGSNRVTVQDVIYTNIELVARKWKTEVRISDELNEDSLISLAEQVVNESALAFSYAEDNAGFNGDGTSAYHGIVGVLNAVNAGSVHTALAGNTAFSTLDLADFITMKGKLPRYPGMMPAWFISQEGYCDSIERLMLAAGGNSVADIAAGGVPRFLGSPVVIVNVLNSTLTTQASTKLLAYGDLSMAAKFGDRRRMSMSLSDQRYWDEDQIGIKATERFDINIHSKGTASAAGAILVLATPAS